MTKISPESLGIVDKDILKKIEIHDEGTFDQDDFNPPSNYYFTNPFGHFIFIKTNKRSIAQDICDRMYGKNFYRVRRVFRAKVF